MSSDKFDDKIREAAENHHPAYNEQAWSKMEKLLDKHLPVKKKKRGLIIFILFFCLLLSGVGFYYNELFTIHNKVSKLNDFDKKDITEKLESDVQSIPNKEINTTNSDKKINSQFDRRKEKQLIVVSREESGTSLNNNTFKIPKNESSYNRIIVKENSATTNRINNFINRDKRADSYNKSVVIHTDSSIKIFNNISYADAGITKNNLNTLKTSGTTGIKIRDKKNGPLQDQPVSGKEDKRDTQKKAIKIKKGFFFLILSAGPDVSYVGSGKAGKIKGLLGLGAGITFRKKFTLRSGFYTGHKVYTATSSSYNPPPPFYTYYPYLEKVDADCKVYEIPLTFSYNFQQNSKQNWFVSAGVSSFLMKTEKYNYYYKTTSGGALLNQSWSINNENKHFFSVFTLSGGFRRQLSKSVFIMGEPYIKLPLSGIGYGKVKLKSTGVLFTLGITPFQSSGK